MGGPALQNVHANPLKNVTSRHKKQGVPFFKVACPSNASCSLRGALSANDVSGLNTTGDLGRSFEGPNLGWDLLPSKSLN
eukprot:5966554-Amphidinium_carterae.1